VHGVRRSDSGGDGLKQRLDAEDIDHPLHIVGEHLQAHFRFDLFKGLGQEVAAAHPRLQGSEGMFDGLPADLHDVWHPIEPSLHRVEHPFVRPALVPFEFVRRALGLESAGRACREVAVVIDVVTTIRARLSLGEKRARWADIMVVLGVVAKILPGEETALCVA